MAGSYPDVPNNRMALDIDGTVAVKISDTLALTQCTQTEMTYLNDETSNSVFTISGPSYSTHYFAIFFPEFRDISGLWAWDTCPVDNNGPFGITTWWWSADTTNGIDGTWTGFTAATSKNAPNAYPYYRNSIVPLSLTNIRAIKCNLYMRNDYNGPSSIRSIHIYGRPSTPIEKLELWHPTLDERVGGAYFDWGDAQRTTNASKTFRVKNTSASLTANSISITFEALTDSTPTYDSMHTFSDGGAYAGTINIGNLAPGALSGTITVKRDMPSNSPLGLWAGRINTTATSWT